MKDEDIQKAFQLKRCLNDFFGSAIGVNLRSTDVNPYLVRAGLFPKDNKNRLFLRQFLHKLKNENFLKLVPHISYVENGKFTNWYFNPVEKSSKGLKQFEAEKKERSNYYNTIIDAFDKKTYNTFSKTEIENTRKYVEDNLLKTSKATLKETYKRNFALWNEKEINLILNMLDKTNDIIFISNLLQRSVNAVEIKYKELKYIQ